MRLCATILLGFLVLVLVVDNRARADGFNAIDGSIIYLEHLTREGTQTTHMDLRVGSVPDSVQSSEPSEFPMTLLVLAGKSMIVWKAFEPCKVDNVYTDLAAVYSAKGHNSGTGKCDGEDSGTSNDSRKMSPKAMTFTSDTKIAGNLISLKGRIVVRYELDSATTGGVNPAASHDTYVLTVNQSATIKVMGKRCELISLDWNQERILKSDIIVAGNDGTSTQTNRDIYRSTANTICSIR